MAYKVVFDRFRADMAYALTTARNPSTELECQI